MDGFAFIYINYEEFEPGTYQGMCYSFLEEKDVPVNTGDPVADFRYIKKYLLDRNADIYLSSTCHDFTIDDPAYTWNTDLDLGEVIVRAQDEQAPS